MKNLRNMTRITAAICMSASIMVSIPATSALASEDLSQKITSRITDTTELLTVTSSGVEGFVTRLYEIALGRSPDPAGLADWVDQLESHRATGVQVAYGFVFSSEFMSKNLSNSDYAECLYEMLLGRPSDPVGKQKWVKALDEGSSRKVVFGGFVNSVEFRKICDSYGIIHGVYVPGVPPDKSSAVTDFVLRLYTICLGRDGDNEGICNWTLQLLNGTASGSGVAYGFVFSEEYLNKNPTAEDYVAMLYRTFLDREPDPDGFDHWVSKILSGNSMESVFEGFVNSQEFSNICSNYGISRGSYTPPSLKDSHFIGSNLFECKVNGESIKIGDSVDVLISRFGSPNRIDPTEYPWTFYVYNSDYSNFFMVAVQDEKVVGWYTDASNMEYMGLTKASSGFGVRDRFPDFDYSSGDLKDCLSDQDYVLMFLLCPLKPGDGAEDLPVNGKVGYTGENKLDAIISFPAEQDKTMTAEICEMCDLTNSFRINAGYSNLGWSVLGAKAARLHSEDMASNNYFSHYSQNGDAPIDRLRKQGVTGLYPSGENIGAGYSDPFVMIFGWRSSNGHLRNLLYRDYTYVGVGVGYSGTSTYKYYWTQDFHS